MIDTIHLTLMSSQTPNKSFLKKLVKVTREGEEKDSEKKFEGYYKCGNWNNFKVLYYDNYKLILQGSLAKYYFGGHNLYTLNRVSIKKAIQKMSDEIGLPIQKSKVTRIDIADNYFVTKPVNYFTSFFGALSYFHKATIKQGETVYMGNKSHQLIFYDKIAELNKDEVIYPKYFKGKETTNAQILRYEYRALKVTKCSEILEILKKNGLKDFVVESLFDKNFYNSLVDIWLDYFEKIPKINTVVSGAANLKTKSDLKNFLAYHGLLTLGTDFVLSAINANITSSERWRKKELMEAFNDISQIDVISEIDPALKSLTALIRIAAYHQKCIDKYVKE